VSKAADLKDAIERYITEAGVPLSEFDSDFVVRMISAMMVSYHKYGLLSKAYPTQYDARSDVRARMAKYRETGNKHYLVDAANFAMIEAMHPSNEDSHWGANSASDSPGRSAVDGRKLISADNDGNRLPGEAILRDVDGPDNEDFKS